jgi:hypothetical protein
MSIKIDRAKLAQRIRDIAERTESGAYLGPRNVSDRDVQVTLPLDAKPQLRSFAKDIVIGAGNNGFIDVASVKNTQDTPGFIGERPGEAAGIRRPLACSIYVDQASGDSAFIRLSAKRFYRNRTDVETILWIDSVPAGETWFLTLNGNLPASTSAFYDNQINLELPNIQLGPDDLLYFELNPGSGGSSGSNFEVHQYWTRTPFTS